MFSFCLKTNFEQQKITLLLFILWRMLLNIIHFSKHLALNIIILRVRRFHILEPVYCRLLRARHLVFNKGTATYTSCSIQIAWSFTQRRSKCSYYPMVLLILCALSNSKKNNGSEWYKQILNSMLINYSSKLLLMIREWY